MRFAHLVILPLLVLPACASDRGHGHAAAGRGPRGAGDHAGMARVFISPMGEPFHTTEGNRGDVTWFTGADQNQDGALSPAEMFRDAARFFATLDLNGDGELDPAEIANYENVVAPEIHVGGGGGGRGGHGGGGGGGGGHHGGGGGGGGGHHGGGEQAAGGDDAASPAPERYPDRQGAGRLGYLNLAEPVVAADTNFDRGVSREEFADAAEKRFVLLDTNGDGKLTRDDLRAARGSR